MTVGSKIFDYIMSNRSPPGHVRAYDAYTGEFKWRFNTVPQPGEPYNETWENGSWATVGNTNVWSFMAADDEAGIVYLPVSTPTNDYWGGMRHGENVFAESLVALNADTGERIRCRADFHAHHCRGPGRQALDHRRSRRRRRPRRRFRRTRGVCLA